MPMPPNPTLKALEVLIGEWDVESRQMPGLRGRAVFEWIEGGAFLSYRARAAEVFPTNTSIISRDDATDAFTMLYYDERGVSRIYQMSLADGVWKLWRDAPGFAQRFEGRFSADSKRITGHWELCRDGTRWEYDFDLTYTKVK